MKYIIAFLTFMFFIVYNSMALDNVTMPYLYAITDLSAHNEVDVNESYSHTYAYDNNSSIVNDSFNIKSQPNGITRVSKITSVSPSGFTNVSSFVGHKSVDENSYLTAEHKTGFQACCRKGPCGTNFNQTYVGSAMGYSTKLYDGNVVNTMSAQPCPSFGASYDTYATTYGNGNQLTSGLSLTGTSNSVSQNYNSHIKVTGKFQVYRSVDIQ